jgi:SAM-dependent methyltransferase
MSEEAQSYLLAGQLSELERLQLQSRVWEPAGRSLLAQLPDGAGRRALDVGCGVMGWLRILSEWLGPAGQVVGSDIDEKMLAAAQAFIDQEGLANVTLVKDDLFATQLAHVVALPREHPYLRLPLQFAKSLESRLAALIGAEELRALLGEVEKEVNNSEAWGITFTLIQAFVSVP